MSADTTDWSDVRAAARTAGLTIHHKYRQREPLPIQLWTVRRDGFMVAGLDHEAGTAVVDILGPTGARRLTDPTPAQALDAARAVGLKAARPTDTRPEED
jgi:hypothetical protein